MLTDYAKRLRAELDRAGYYPELVAGVLDVAVAEEEVHAFLVHPETTFDHAEVFRHLTAMVLTQSRLIIAHVDDAPGSSPDAPPAALATTEAVGLHHIRSVSLTHGVSDPEQARAARTQELTLSVTWGTSQSVDLAPAGCGDPDCDADHGYTGALAPEGVELRVAAPAEGERALHAAIAFARELSAATARR